MKRIVILITWIYVKIVIQFDMVKVGALESFLWIIPEEVLWLIYENYGAPAGE